MSLRLVGTIAGRTLGELGPAAGAGVEPPPPIIAETRSYTVQAIKPAPMTWPAIGIASAAMRVPNRAASLAAGPGANLARMPFSAAPPAEPAIAGGAPLAALPAAPVPAEAALGLPRLIVTVETSKGHERG